jgi:hypothetical protein
LMLPPMPSIMPGPPDLKAPRLTWQVIASFADEKECRKEMRQRADSEKLPFDADGFRSQWDDAFRCVAIRNTRPFRPWHSAPKKP